ncbi:MAG: hypothetical protein PUP91_13495 [Rhizonema sp. PD37]|nr:hypothetical protein [Rhizonema sp. PD37]
MKRIKALMTVFSSVAISIGMIPTLPVDAANGEITCNNLIRDNGYAVVGASSGRVSNTYGGGERYSYLYRIRNRRDGRVRRIACVWNERRNSARLIYR